MQLFSSNKMPVLMLDICSSSLVMVGRLHAGLESHVASPAEALQTDAGCHRAMASVKPLGSVGKVAAGNSLMMIAIWI